MLKKIFSFTVKLFSKMKEDNIFELSAQFSYYIILGIFPFLILSISMLCKYSSFLYEILFSVELLLPKEVYGIVYNIVTKSVNSCSNSYISMSVLVLLWTASEGSTTIISGINRAYGFEVKRNYFFMRLEGILFSLAIMLSMHVIFALIVVGKNIISFVQDITLLSEIIYILIHLIRFILPFLMMFFVFSAAYKFLTYEKVSFSFVFPGAAFSTVGITAGSYVYSLYVSTRSIFYSSIYGSLSGLIIFLLWIYLLSAIFLIGAEINHFAGKYKPSAN